MDLEEWKKKNRASRHYAHFDEKISLGRAWNYISNPENVKKHGFYPFIHYEKKFNKYKKENDAGFIKEKTRDLCYSAHIDRYIYSYAICAARRPLVRLPAATRRSPTATFIKVFR